MQRLAIEKKIKKIHTRVGKDKIPLSRLARDVSSELYKIKSATNRDHYLRKEFGLKSDKRRTILKSIYNVKVDIKDEATCVLGLTDTPKARAHYFAKRGIAHGDRKKILREFESLKKKMARKNIDRGSGLSTMANPGASVSALGDGKGASKSSFSSSTSDTKVRFVSSDGFKSIGPTGGTPGNSRPIGF